MYCEYCAKNCSNPDHLDGKICCSTCGRVLEENIFADDPTFVKDAGGQSRMAGRYVKTMQSDNSVSRDRIIDEARYGIDNMRHSLNIDGGSSIVNPAVAFYTIAVERNFTRGRRKEQVEAACLYIACREKKKPFLLIDFSDYLRINVYVLGAVFLQLCKLLSLDEHPLVQKPVDPSLFIHRFTDRLFGGKQPNGVSKTALHIIASMKRDWMQTGRKPSGLCGAALYVSSLAHGLKCTKNEILKVVHVCEATLTKRLIEFENTESGGLTIEEFNVKAEELEKEERLNKPPNTGSKALGFSELLCEHKGSGGTPVAHGLCKYCYEDFIKLSGGLDGGLEPPAFQQAEMERNKAMEAADQNSENLDYNLEENSGKESRPKKGSEYLDFQEESNVTGSSSQLKTGYEFDATVEDSETLSDIDDTEVEDYLLNEKEKELKNIIWSELNKEYLEEQAAKDAAELAAKKAHEAMLANCSEEELARLKLAAESAALVAKSKKEKQQKRAAELKSAGPAKTPVEATKQMLDKKRLSSKINYDLLDKLFDESEIQIPVKKGRIEPESNYEEDYTEEPYMEDIQEDNVENYYDPYYDDS